MTTKKLLNVRTFLQEIPNVLVHHPDWWWRTERTPEGSLFGPPYGTNVIPMRLPGADCPQGTLEIQMRCKSHTAGFSVQSTFLTSREGLIRGHEINNGTLKRLSTEQPSPQNKAKLERLVRSQPLKHELNKQKRKLPFSFSFQANKKFKALFLSTFRKHEEKKLAVNCQKSGLVSSEEKKTAELCQGYGPLVCMCVCFLQRPRTSHLRATHKAACPPLKEYLPPLRFKGTEAYFSTKHSRLNFNLFKLAVCMERQRAQN